MDNYNFHEYLRVSLHQLFPNSKDDGARNNVLVNCPLCIREGRPDTKHHMSICLGKGGRPLFYNCFRNSLHRGILSSNTLPKLTDLNIDPMLLEAIDNYNKNHSSFTRYKLPVEKRFNIDVGLLSSNDIIEAKRLYICNRLGLDLSLEELVKDKIIFSIKHLLWINYINRFTRDERIMDLLDKYFVGFLTNTNGCVVLRNIVHDKIQLPDSINFRYIKYLIQQGESTGYYIIPTICDITKQTEIIIAEGQFDILSIFYNIYKGDRTNKIYSCIGGNSYLKIIKYFLCEMGLVNPIFHIYIDNDIKNFVLPQLQKIIHPLNIEIYIHINSYPQEKDFGVPKEKIKDYYYKL